MSRRNAMNLMIFALTLIHEFGYDKYYDDRIIYKESNKYNNKEYEKNMRNKCNQLEKNNKILKR